MRQTRNSTHPMLLAFLIAFSLLSIPVLAGAAQPEMSRDAASDAERAPKTRLILGVSWQPGYCAARPKSTECANVDAQALSGRQFSLHGLWTPKKRYCGVDAAMKATDKKRKWLELPELALEAGVKAELVQAMPGMASGLERHEWLMHGTCSGRLASDYYRHSLALLAALNQSAVRALFEKSIGQTVDEAAVKQAFDSAFGAGAGDKVRMRCRKVGTRQVVTGLTIGLGSDDEDALPVLIAAAGKTKFGCREGIVSGYAPAESD
ncbi:ribonuclease T2 family protein [Rhizobium alvei]|uniref:Ribonuclease n=1 Tax=Rhizobium alvei TaxID=1132659 RepID=A0ABT8YIQ5_9HYPH|nr:ribonuclease [Rhizobium alvei]MDO6963545.1 ribonuclease [Rhizobium alvei]